MFIVWKCAADIVLFWETNFADCWACVISHLLSPAGVTEETATWSAGDRGWCQKSTELILLLFLSPPYLSVFPTLSLLLYFCHSFASLCLILSGSLLFPLSLFLVYSICVLFLNKQSLTHVTVVCKIRWNWKRKHYSAGNPVGFLLFSLLSLEICAGVENEAVLEESRKQVPVSFIV